jgi:hypothetical protein
MATISQVVEQIRFALENLSERNGQHEFEHLCRHFARHRICFNVLPATGPVGGGGDQGRDFESFRTFIQGLGSGKFGGAAEGKKLAFACSLQKEVNRKIRSDVASIMSHRESIDIIYFFSSRPVSISKRHSYQAWARKTYKVELEIVDREALAEQLSDPEIFWIAVSYLNVPSEIFPPLGNANDFYNDKKSSWTKSVTSPAHYSDFVDLKQCWRYALAEMPQDIPFWLDLLQKFEKSQVGKTFWPQVAYEIIVLIARQRRSFRGQEDRLRVYFTEVRKFKFPDEVENATVVLSYMVAMYRLGEISMEGEEIHRVWVELRDKIDNGIKKPLSKNQLCLWLELRSSLSFTGGVTIETLPNIDETFSIWLRIAEECRNAPTFPVKKFHDELFDYIKLIGEHQKFDEILDKLRPEIGSRTGEAALAESHFRRAEQFDNQKQYIRAIRELHNAKVKWFVGETLEQSTNCSILLATCYSRLGLHYAALYYSLAAGFIIANSTHSWPANKILDCLMVAANAVYHQGHWCSFCGFTESLLILHGERALNPRSIKEHEHLVWLVRSLPPALIMTERFSPSHLEEFRRLVRKWGFETLIDEGVNELKPHFDSLPENKFRTSLTESFTGPPFSDAGKQCVAVWSALGIIWSVRWENSHKAFRVAGECVAFLQIAIAELAGCDLDIVPGCLDIEIQLSNQAKLSMEQIPDNAAYRYRLYVPSAPKSGLIGVNDYVAQTLVGIMQMVRSFSVTPSSKFEDLFIKDRGPNIYQHTFFARRFHELIDYFLPPARFNLEIRSVGECPFPFDNWAAATSPELAWIDSIHRGFSEAAEIKRIRIRYHKTIRSIRYTAGRLKGNPDFKATLKDLRSKNWKDWHILQAMANIVAKYRTTLRMGPYSDNPAWKRVFLDEIFQKETENSAPVPTRIFSKFEIEFTAITVILNTVTKHMNLELHQTTPNTEGLCEYLRRRWRYWDLDVEHEKVFDET